MQHYVDGKDIVFFDLNNPEQMAADVSWLLGHPAEATIIAQNGQNKAKERDSWEVRYKYICDLISDVLGCDIA